MWGSLLIILLVGACSKCERPSGLCSEFTSCVSCVPVGNGPNRCLWVLLSNDRQQCIVTSAFRSLKVALTFRDEKSCVRLKKLEDNKPATIPPPEKPSRDEPLPLPPPTTTIVSQITSRRLDDQISSVSTTTISSNSHQSSLLKSILPAAVIANDSVGNISLPTLELSVSTTATSFNTKPDFGLENILPTTLITNDSVGNMPNLDSYPISPLCPFPSPKIRISCPNLRCPTCRNETFKAPTNTPVQVVCPSCPVKACPPTVTCPPSIPIAMCPLPLPAVNCPPSVPTTICPPSVPTTICPPSVPTTICPPPISFIPCPPAPVCPSPWRPSISPVCHPCRNTTTEIKCRRESTIAKVNRNLCRGIELIERLIAESPQEDHKYIQTWIRRSPAYGNKACPIIKANRHKYKCAKY